MVMNQDHRHIFEIQQLLALYAVALDSRRPSLLADCFTSSAVLDLGGMGTFSIAAYQQLCAEELPKLDATQHHLGLPLIQVEGQKAYARCSFMAQHVRNALAPDPTLLIGGWYDDELVHSEDRWLIEHRTGTATWYSGNMAVLGYQFPAGAVPRTAAMGPPSWLLEAR